MSRKIAMRVSGPVVTCILLLVWGCSTSAGSGETEDSAVTNAVGTHKHPSPGRRQLELARLGSLDPVQFAFQDLAASESFDFEFQSSEWATATVVDATGQVVSAEVLSEGCFPPSREAGRTWQVPSEVDTIQGALDAAAAGDTVQVAAGTYYEHLTLADGVRLVGSGAFQTILDGQGLAQNLVQLVGGRNVVVQGFTFRGVGPTNPPTGDEPGCTSGDPLGCSGNWYASGLYVSLSDEQRSEQHLLEPCDYPSIIVAQNIFEENDIGMMAYFKPHVVLRNNIFQHNRVGFAANHHGSGTGLIDHNVFFENEKQAVALSASFIDVINNIFVTNGIACDHEYVQRGRVNCNVFFDNGALGEDIEDGEDGNVILDPLFAAAEQGDFSLLSSSAALTAGCIASGEEASQTGAAGGGQVASTVIEAAEAGIFGGSFGSWGGGQ